MHLEHWFVLHCTQKVQKMDTDEQRLQTIGDYKHGSIKRVKMHQFLTYKDVEVFPGPRLNMVRYVTLAAHLLKPLSRALVLLGALFPSPLKT